MKDLRGITLSGMETTIAGSAVEASSFLKDPGDHVLDIALEYADQMASPHSMILLYMVHARSRA